MVKHHKHLGASQSKLFSPEERTRFCAAKLHWARESLPFPPGNFFVLGVSVVQICLIKNQFADQQDITCRQCNKTRTCKGLICKVWLSCHDGNMKMPHILVVKIQHVFIPEALGDHSGVHGATRHEIFKQVRGGRATRHPVGESCLLGS